MPPFALCRWPTLVIGTYNAVDLLARLDLKRLQAAAGRLAVWPAACVGACAARLLFLPVIYLCVLGSPPPISGSAGNVLILLAVALLALSNGFLATASMMQVARLAPAGLGEEATYVAVGGVYFGLALGATISASLPLGDCAP